jgi:hypothetical protein
LYDLILSISSLLPHLFLTIIHTDHPCRVYCDTVPKGNQTQIPAVVKVEKEKNKHVDKENKECNIEIEVEKENEREKDKEKEKEKDEEREKDKENEMDCEIEKDIVEDIPQNLLEPSSVTITTSGINTKEKEKEKEKEKDKEKEEEKGKEKEKEVDGEMKYVCVGSMKRPAMSLTRFLRETEKRRRAVLDEIIHIS